MIFIKIFGILFLLFSAQGFAQDVNKPVTNTSTPSNEETAELLTELNEKLQRQQAQIEELQDKYKQQASETKNNAAELAYAAEEREDLGFSMMEAGAASDEQKFTVFGFMDTTFTAAFPNQREGQPNWESPIYFETARRSNFYQLNVNLFFKSEMSPTLESLVEARFTYQPNGKLYTYPRILHINGQPTSSGEYVREDTTVKEPYTGSFRLGGVVIERAQFDWKPRDWFKVRIGRYLTPFGIWHEDHGSTVRLSVISPFIVVQNYVPTAQTGLMIFGQSFIGSNMDLEYAFTLSNGRGPYDELRDIDSNKAIGLRTKLHITIGEFSMTAGAYGYMGQYTDSTDAMHIFLNSTASEFDENVDMPVQWTESIVEKYDEIILATDLQFHFKGLHLLGEYVRAKVEYIVPTPIYEITPFLIGSPTSEDAIESNRISQAWYATLAYDLPLKRLTNKIKITPFAVLDYLEPTDTYDSQTVYSVQWGINFKPSPFVVLKTNVHYIIAKDKTLMGGNYLYWGNQVAVSF